MIYAVIDTNVIVSALITKHSDAASYRILSHTFQGDIVPLYNEVIIEEYKDVLGRKKFHLTQSEIDSVVEYFYTYGIKLDRTSFDEIMPDEEDRVFNEISLSKEDSFLITGNLKHFPASPKVVSPSDFVRLMGF